MRKLALIFTFLLPLTMSAQELLFEQEKYPFPTYFGIHQSFFGYTQAYSDYKIDFCDIDFDNDLDLFVNVSAGNFLFCENIGDSSEPEYIRLYDQIIIPPETGVPYAPTFCDINNDGKDDLFLCLGYGGIALYVNQGNAGEM